MSSSTADETGASKYPDMALAQQMHRLLSSSTPEHRSVELETQVFDKILVELENPSLYRSLQTKLYQDKTPTLASAKITKDTLTALETQHADHVKTLEENIATARESAGDMEVLEAQLQLAQFAAKSLSETEALQAYQAILQSSKLSSGKQMDVLMEMTRVASFYDNSKLADDYLEQTLKLAASSGGGDWDRRNRLQVYQALQQLLHRNLQKAASLLVDCIATFSCTELCTYTECILYATLTNLLHLPRVELKEKIIDGPEVLGVAKELPAVLKLVQAFYNCDYKTYLHAMIEVEHVLKQDRYLAPHTAFWMRELHILAYKQFLDSYQSVTIQAMATAFGVSTDFIDHHASRYIASNRLSAKIDKFGGVIVTNRPDEKNAQYRDMIQKGDLLLNRIQKLARVLDL